MTAKRDLDVFDLKLLSEVQKNAQLSQGELGAKVNLSAAAVNRRLKRLADEGIIKKYVAVIAPEALGYALNIVAQVEVERERIDLLDAMKKVFEACPQVQQCYWVTGEWDFVLMLAVRDMEQYNELTRQMFFKNNNVKRFKTLVVLKHVKSGLEVPID
ncbi:Lrp/AsnC family transcriptional regulator [Granulicella arctica]|uniref:DNA-binding Lrp family transcriptional regulator n=1 Tax=Granulicella arctica TaxID=940613 RepID=A0A7Y9PGB2_9BACT|nr:Lrp/AsnC family transcriptional regulator [Granulicella arctica]NYF78618.1 DNA-binding Lrp family transcriptional regulator [Granulicella arctica]